MSKKIQVNDQIIEVDGRSLYGYTNHEAVEVLRSAGKVVKLRLARYLRGTKFEQLQQAIASTDISATSQTSHFDPHSHSESIGSGSTLFNPVCYKKRKSMGPLDVHSLPQSAEEFGKENSEILPPPPAEHLLQNEWTRRIGNEFIVVVSHFERMCKRLMIPF